jgi:pyruvate,water dikinase
VGTAGQAHGPLLGPGPVGETFPDPLRPLQVDLWIPPLRDGIESALHIVGAVPQRAVADSPVATTIAGRVACDLELLGASPDAPGAWRWLDPRQSARRLSSAWRVGPLLAVLPDLALRLCPRIDADLAEIPPLHEADAETAAAVAVSVVLRGRDLGLSDEQIVQRRPEALALTAPRIGAPAPLPPVLPAGVGSEESAGGRVVGLPAREALRLRGAGCGNPPRGRPRSWAYSSRPGTGCRPPTR